jgi:large subunit ribosomal protein L31e
MTIERTYTIPLRKGFINAPRYKKTKNAVSELKYFLSRHMKSENVLIGKHLNEHLWLHGIKNPPHSVKVVVIKEDDGTVKAELAGFKYDHKKKEQKDEKEEPKKKDDKAEPKKKDDKVESKKKDYTEADNKPVKKEKVDDAKSDAEHTHSDTHEHKHDHATEHAHTHTDSREHAVKVPSAKKKAAKKE